MQPNPKNGLTPLMVAARSASDETVSLLLCLGANPDKTDDNGKTALMMAIQSKCSTTMNLLARVTQVKLGYVINWLARERIELTIVELRQLVERAAQDKKTVIEGLIHATKYGSSEIVKIIAENMLNNSVFEANKEILWMKAVESDSEATVSALLDILPSKSNRLGGLPNKEKRSAMGGQTAPA